MKYAEFKQKAKKFWANSKFEWIVVGSFKEDKILELVKHFEETVKPTNPETLSAGCLKIDKDLEFAVYTPSDDIKTSCTLVYFEHGRESYRDKILLEILKVYIKEPFFNELRTKKQLAYYVSSKVCETRGVLGMHFILVSSNTDPKSCEKHMKDFITPHFAGLK